MVLERSPEVTLPSYKPELVVERTDISFHDLNGDRVCIEIAVHNAGQQRSLATPMRLESAPLGAFVPWQPLARLLVPSLEPGETRVVGTVASRSRPTPLGDFNRVPPKKLLTALSSEDPSAPQAGNGLMTIFELLRRGRTGPASNKDLARRGSLSPDLWELLGRGQPHWAGNINVFIGSHAVERHLAKALRVYPGRPNLAMFVVGGSGRSDAYIFELVGLAPEWKAGLFDMRNSKTLVVSSHDVPIEERQWVESNGSLLVMLATHPPAGCRTGKLQVPVTRRSDGKTATVEFDLDPAAQGAGCYCV